jgi:soluble lytic murein transglycosylase
MSIPNRFKSAVGALVLLPVAGMIYAYGSSPVGHGPSHISRAPLSIDPNRASTHGSGITSISLLELRSKALAESTHQEALRVRHRLKHAKELLGKHYHKSVVKSGESVGALDETVSEWIEEALRKRFKKHSDDISQTIISESERYGFDPVFLMAVIRSESSFNPEVIGPFGEIGLMQLTPQTAQWISGKYNLPWLGTESLKDPITNIKIGAAYMAYLREKFACRGQLYLSAYNMGSTNVYRNLSRKKLPRVYHARVMGHYTKFYSQLKCEQPVKSFARKQAMRYDSAKAGHHETLRRSL